MATACSAHRATEVERHPAVRTASAIVAEPVFLEDLLPEADPVRDNVTVGNVTFSGGFVTVDSGRGLQNISKEMAIADEERYRADAFRALEPVLATLGGSQVPAPAIPEPHRRARRGTQRHDGTDNRSLPHYDLAPRPLDAAALDGLPAADVLWVPIVVHLYTHNGGWFYGQTYGSAAGARFRVLLVAYDRETGEVRGSTDVAVRWLHDELFSPNSAQIEDMQIDVERQMQKQLLRHSP